MMKYLSSLLLCTTFTYAGGRSTHKGKESQTEPPVIFNESAAPTVKGNLDVYFSADFIYWHARQDNLEYAETSSVRPLVNSQSVGKGSRKDVHFGFEPGFKLGLGLNFKYDRWDICAVYTWLNPATHHSSAKNDENTLRSRWVIPTVLGTTAREVALTQATAKWKMDFNVLDLELGRNFYVGKKLTARPQVGFKLGFIDQDYDLDYDLDTAIENFGNSVDIDMDQDYVGFGIRTGVGCDWMFSRNWGVFADVAVSVLWSHFNDERKDATAGSLLGETETYNTRHEFNTVRPVLEIDLGLRYTVDFKKRDKRLDFQAGWEEQLWFSQNQFPSPFSDHSGDLVIQGLTLKVLYSF